VVSLANVPLVNADAVDPKMTCVIGTPLLEPHQEVSDRESYPKEFSVEQNIFPGVGCAPHVRESNISGAFGNIDVDELGMDLIWTVRMQKL
jgi:hypothetical protein